MKDICDYLYNKRGVIETLGAITPEKQRLSKQQKIVRLHNLVNQWFYQQDGHTAYELRIDFDPKKVNTTYFDLIHKELQLRFNNKYAKHVQYVLMREWGTNGTQRLHYHGLVYFRREGNQTDMAKFKVDLVRQYGSRSKIQILTYPDSYIPYMFKRFLLEDILFSSEIICSLPLVGMVNHPDGRTDDSGSEGTITSKYTWKSLMDYQEQRRDSKLLVSKTNALVKCIKKSGKYRN